MKKEKIIKILICFVICTYLSSCSLIEEMFKTNEINIEDIFTQEENEYYIYFYKEDCPYCEAVEDIVNNLENSEVSLYRINLSINENKLIGRSYTGENGEGVNGKYLVNSVTDYKDLYISIAPTIIKIITNSETGQKEAIYVAGGSSEIIEYFLN